MMKSVHVGVHDALLDPSRFLKTRLHRQVVGGTAHIRHFSFPALLIGVFGESDAGNGIGLRSTQTIEMVANDSHFGRRGAVIHGSHCEACVVRETFRDHNLGGGTGALKSGVKRGDKSVELRRSPDSRFVTGIPIRLILGRDGHHFDPGTGKLAVSVLNIVGQVARVARIVIVKGIVRTGTLAFGILGAGNASNCPVSFISRGRRPFGAPNLGDT
jgi:hypothetical protein